MNMKRHRSTLDNQQGIQIINSSRRIKKQPIKLKPQQQELTILIITWNLMGSIPQSQYVQYILNKQHMNYDLIVFGTQQCQRSLFQSFFCEGKQNWQLLLNGILQQNYTKLTSQILQGLHLIIYIKKDKFRYVSNIRKNVLKLGFLGIIGNKGAIQIGLQIGSKRFLFVNAHLDATTHKTKIRNQHLNTIMKKIIDKQIVDEVFLFGDLNYRISLKISIQTIEEKIKNQQFLYLLENQQLKNQTQLADFLKQFKQADIKFPPTYKLDSQKNKYYQLRNPGWTDRIFYKAQPLQDLQLQIYDSDFRALGSDHRPVYATFCTKFNKFKSGNVKIKQQQSNCNLI